MDNKYVNKALELSSKVASNVYLDAISKGLMGTLPILIIGSIGCLLGTEMQLEDVERFEKFRIPYIIIDNA